MTNQTEEKTDLELQNDQIRITLSKKPGCHAHMEIFVQPKGVQAAYNKAIKDVKKQVSIPGFRQGKAPDDIVKKNFASQIEREWKDICLQTAMNESFALSKLYPLSRSSIKRANFKKCSQEEGAHIVADYEYEPVLPHISFEQLSTTLILPKDAEDADVEHKLEEFRLQRATWEEISNREVQDGDYALVDLDVIENPAHNVFTDRLFKVTKDTMPKWAYDLVLGMKVDESREGKANPDFQESDAKQEGHAKKEKKLCRLTLKAIRKPILPEINDAFAKEIAGVDSVEELRKRVKNVVQIQSLNAAREKARLELFYELAEKFPIELPSSIIDSEVKARFQSLKTIADKSQGAIPFDTTKENEIKAEILADTRNFFTVMFLLRPLASQLKLDVTQNELMQELTYETTFLPPQLRIVYPGVDPQEARSRLIMRITMRKCLDVILMMKAQQQAPDSENA